MNIVDPHSHTVGPFGAGRCLKTDVECKWRRFDALVSEATCDRWAHQRSGTSDDVSPDGVGLQTVGPYTHRYGPTPKQQTSAPTEARIAG